MEILKSIYRAILRKLPDKPAIYLIFFRGYRKKLNLNNPRYFGEKIQWLKLYGNLEEVAPYVDKYEVRDFIKRKIGEKYLTKLYGLYDSVGEIDFEKLPQSFVIKCTNGSGSVYVCKNKANMDINKVVKMMDKWMKDDFSKMKKEPQYKNVKNRIIIEEYLEDESGALRDYKFYCYDGKPYYYGVFTDRYTDETVDMYDMSGNKLEGVMNGGVKNSNMVLPLPKCFEELCQVTEKLAAPFQFVRIDYYIVNDNIYFGELTFTDGAGSDPFSPLEFDIEMGSRIKLGNVIVNKNLL